jgi:hypothetical protein
MNRKHKFFLPAMAFVVLLGLQLSAGNAFAQGPGPGGPGAGGPGGFGGGRGSRLPPIPLAEDTTHSITKHFTPSTPVKKAPDAKGFIQRWLVLDPIKKNLRGNSAITETYLKTTFATENFSPDFNFVPKNNSTVTITPQDLKFTANPAAPNGIVSKTGDPVPAAAPVQELQWHALDSKTFNFNLYHFSYATNKARAGVLFWLVTVINCTEEIKNVRLAAGVNSGGAFWLNGEQVLTIPGDKDIIVDNVASPLLTLKKGKNVLRAAIINGQGLCNFVARFIDDKGQPVKNYTLSYE